MSGVPALAIEDLRVELRDGVAVIEGVSLRVEPGEIVGLIGETGSGKTTTALAALGHAAPGLRIAGGQVIVAGERVDVSDPAKLRKLRGSGISYVPQDPGDSLNPSLRIGEIVRDMLRSHRPDIAPGTDPVEAVFARAQLPATAEFRRRYPFQLSGGQGQRVAIAVGLVCEPAVIILDEPTTGLDVVTQAGILAELDALRRKQRIACLYVSHDLAAVAQIADRIAVMYAGRVVEEGPTGVLLARPRHPYTRGLLASVPDHKRPRRLSPMAGAAVAVSERPEGCAFAPRCELAQDRCRAGQPDLVVVGERHRAACLRWQETSPPVIASRRLEPNPAEAHSEAALEVSHLRAEHHSRGEVVVAAADVSFTIAPGARVALVGESGSGKTTIARTIAGLHPVASGAVRFHGEALGISYKRTVEQRRAIQMVFQNPLDALNPKQRVGAQVARPARVLRGLSAKAAKSESEDLLARVRLSPRIADGYPHELSGGERQRVGIARAIAAQPQLIVCDEITSALDVSVQAAVLELLNELSTELGVGMLFITHDLGVVATVAEEILVLERGLICERGATASVLASPQHPYTKQLLGAAPSLSDRMEGIGAPMASGRT